MPRSIVLTATNSQTRRFGLIGGHGTTRNDAPLVITLTMRTVPRTGTDSPAVTTGLGANDSSAELLTLNNQSVPRRICRFLAGSTRFSRRSGAVGARD